MAIITGKSTRKSEGSPETSFFVQPGLLLQARRLWWWDNALQRQEQNKSEPR